MQINRATDYAIRVMIHLATLPPGSKAQLIALEHATGVRGSFLSKVMQRLTHASSLRSVAMAADSVSAWTATKLRSSKSWKRRKVRRTATCAWQLEASASASHGAAFTLSGCGYRPLLGMFLPASRSASRLETQK